LPLDVVEKGLAVLEQPDRRSRRAIEHGRRIVRIDSHRDWGWRIVNYGHYRVADAAERQEQWRRAHPDEVAAQNAKRASTSSDTTPRNGASRPVTARNQAEAEAYAEAEAVDLGISEMDPAQKPVDRTKIFAPNGAATVRTVLEAIAGSKPSQPARKDDGLNRDRLKSRLDPMRPADRKRFFELAGWFWKTGTRDMDAIEALMDDAIINKPDNWFAFYAADGKVRLAIEARVRDKRLTDEKNAISKEERAYFGENFREQSKELQRKVERPKVAEETA
jgi:hypothetical protein